MKSIEAIMLTEACTNLVDHYHGLVIDHMNCLPQHEQLFSSLCGDHLFYHIVDDAQTATKIIHHLNEANMPGEFQFMAANLVAHDHDFDKTVMDCLDYSLNFENIFEYIICGLDNMENNSLTEIIMKNTIQFYKNYRKNLNDLSSCDLAQYMLNDQMKTITDDIKHIDNELNAHSKKMIEKSKKHLRLQTLQKDEESKQTQKQRWTKQETVFQRELSAMVIEKNEYMAKMDESFLNRCEEDAIDDMIKKIDEENIHFKAMSKRFADISDKSAIANNYLVSELLKTKSENKLNLLKLEEKMKNLDRSESNIEKLSGTLCDIKMNLDRFQKSFDHKMIESKNMKDGIKILTEKLQQINSKSINLNKDKTKLVYERKQFQNEAASLMKRYKTASIDSEEIVYTEDEVSSRFFHIFCFILFVHKFNYSIFLFHFYICSALVENFIIRNQ